MSGRLGWLLCSVFCSPVGKTKILLPLKVKVGKLLEGADDVEAIIPCT